MTQQPETTRARNVVVNADDFGMSRQINEAILQAFEKGLISSATLMANMPAFEEACQLVRQDHLQRRIGLHLNLTEGKPLTADIADCPRFCDAGGCWRPRRRVLGMTGKRYWRWKRKLAHNFWLASDRGLRPRTWIRTITCIPNGALRR